MKRMLSKTYFKDNITNLIDRPKDEIEMVIKQKYDECKAICDNGETMFLFIYYAGHGCQVLDFNNLD